MSDYNTETQESTGPKYRDAEWLREKYHDEGLSANKMAEECSVHPNTVRKWMERHGIERRSLSESHMIGEQGGKYRNESWLREKYVGETKTQYELADLCGVDQGTIAYWLNKHGIEARDRSEAMNPDARMDLLRDESWLREKYHGQSLTIYDIADHCNVRGGTVAKWLDRNGIEARSGAKRQARNAESYKFTDSEWLRREYIGEGRAAASLADECGVSKATIYRHLERAGIETRSPIQFGEDHPNWTGNHPYRLEDWHQARQKAFREWGEECQSCGLSREDHREKHGVDIEVHHIRKVTTFENPKDANDVDNLVPLCKECHKRWEGVPVRPTLM